MPTSYKSSSRKPWLGLLGLVILAAVVLTVLELTNTTHFFHKASVTAHAISANANTKGAKGTAILPGNGNPVQSINSQDKNSDTSNTTLIAPTGDFVSNHHPNLSGSPAPNLMTSNCTTTPGATCQIIFTNGSTIKTLPVETTDSGGSAYWNWKLQDFGITQGTWTIEAKATLNGQTQTATDALSLDVGP